MANAKRLRVLIITRNLPPLVGGMERLNWHMAAELSRRAEMRVIGPQGSAERAPSNVPIIEVPLRPLWKFLAQAQWRALREARRWRPDVVLAGSGLTAPLAFLAAKVCGARAAVYLHGLDIGLRNAVYRALWLPAIRRSDCVIANSSATRQMAIEAGVPPERIAVVHPGVELPESQDHAERRAAFRKQYQLGDRPVLLSVGRLSERKGLREFVTHVLPRITAVHPGAVLLIVGDAPKDALHAEAQTPESIRAAAMRAGVVDNVRFLGRISDDELNALYHAADLHVFPVLDIPGNPEGFGMVAIEAAAHGLPTVAYATGGVTDAVAEGQSGHLIAPRNAEAFTEAVLQLFEHPLPSAPLRAHAEQFTWQRFGDALWSALPVASNPNVRID